MKERSIPAAFALFLALALLCADARAGEEERSRKPDPALEICAQAIRETFQAHRGEFLKPLLPEAGKVYLKARVLAQEADYYSQDQILALLAQAFRKLRTRIFRLDTPSPEEGEPRLALLPAAWVFNIQGESRRIRLHFILIRRSDRWTLSEIREAG